LLITPVLIKIALSTHPIAITLLIPGVSCGWAFGNLGGQVLLVEQLGRADDAVEVRRMDVEHLCLELSR
jgi:hypothetical protein